MKRLLLGTLFSFITTIFIGCSEKTPEPSKQPKPNKEVDLALFVEKGSIKAEETAKFTISTEIPPEQDLIINVASNDSKVATVPATVTLKAGSLSVEGAVTAVASGKVTITISTVEKIRISTSSQVITVVSEGDVLLNLSVEKSQIYTGEQSKLTIATEVASKTDVTIKLASSKTSVVTVPSTITLRAGEKNVTCDVVGVAVGVSTITMSVDKVAVGIKKIEITVLEKPLLVLSISAEPHVGIGSTIKLAVTTPGPATERLILTLVNDNSSVTELGTTTLTLEPGALSAQTTLKGLAIGESNISFTVSPSVKIDKSTVKVFSGNVRTDIVPFIVPITITIPEGSGGNNWESVNYAPEARSLGLWTTTATWLETQVGTTQKITIENYGHDWVGEMRNGYGIFTPVAEGTLINNDLPWQKGSESPRTRPAVWLQDGFSIGENVYIVLYCEYSPEFTYHRGWLKVTTTTTGVLTVLDGALCTTNDDDVEFRVGQKQ